MTYLELHLEYGFPDFAGSSVFVAKLRQTPQGPPSLHRLHGQVESTSLLPNKVRTVGHTHYVTYIEKSTLVFPPLELAYHSRAHIYYIHIPHQGQANCEICSQCDKNKHGKEISETLNIFVSSLRFQEIAGSLEEKLSLPLLEAKVAGTNQSDDVRGFPAPPPPFKLELFQVLWKCLHRCWQDGVFILALVHRFWKLTLQVYTQH